jgi:hypothetical protein
MVHQDISMPLFAMLHGILGMFHGFTHMLVSVNMGAPIQPRETNKRGNRRNDQYSAMDFHFHGFLLSG